jgi:uncharacterized protein (TIGR02646 family)
MKKVENYFDTIPKNLSFGRKKTKDFLTEILVSKKVEGKHYGREGVKETLLKIYNHSCAYCEQFIEKSAHIEHYRPKKEDMYYWLGMTWSNFLIACSDCNTAKLDKFEIDGQKAAIPECQDQVDFLRHYNNDWQLFLDTTHIASDTLIKESPKMLHPAIDEPKNHLFFEANGTITSLTDKGSYFLTTCKISDFDDRKALIDHRASKVEDIRDQIVALEIISNDNELEDLLDNHLGLILKRVIDKKEFSALYLSCYENFDAFFISKLSEPFQSRLRLIYRRLLSKIYQ